MGLVRALRDLWRYRQFLWNVTVLQLRLRYKVAVLGFLWSLLRPLFLSLVLFLVFRTFIRFGVDGPVGYGAFIVASMLPWAFFSGAVFDGVGSLVGNTSLLQKVSVPIEIFPLSAAVANLVNFALAVVVVLPLLALARQIPIGPGWLMIPVAAVHILLLSAGLVCIASTLFVFYRDVGLMLEVVMAAWFYFTPVFYQPKIVFEQLASGAAGSRAVVAVFLANPMFAVMDRLRWGLWGEESLAPILGARAQAVSWQLWIASFSFSLLLFCVGLLLVRRKRTAIIDFL